MNVDPSKVVELLERFPKWPHAPLGARPAQVAQFASAVLQGSTFHGWPDDHSPRAVVALQSAPWDSEKLGVPAARLFAIVPPDESAAASQLLSRVLEYADRAGLRYLVSRVDAADLGAIQAMEKSGFVVVDAILSQYLDPRTACAPSSSELQVRFAEPGDAEALAEIADECFTMSRFHNDPWIGGETARGIYRDWARNIARGLNDLNLVAVSDERVVGFLSCKDVPAARSTYRQGYCRIELVAIAPLARGRGGVAAMTRRLIDEAPARDWQRIGIGTQVANVQAMRAYQKVGFVPGDSIFTLRRLT